MAEQVMAGEPAVEPRGLLLDDLEIRNFRGFDHLVIPRLARINLIVGKNNVGKSALLEALRLYAQRGVPAVLWTVLAARDEIDAGPRRDRETLTSDEVLRGLRQLFAGWGHRMDRLGTIQIGPGDTPDGQLAISVAWQVQEDANGRIVRELQTPYVTEPAGHENAPGTILGPYLAVRFGEGAPYLFPVDGRMFHLHPRATRPAGVEEGEDPAVFVPPGGLTGRRSRDCGTRRS